MVPPPQVFDGKDLIPITEEVRNTGDKAPVPPAEEGDGTIFVVLPSFRDGQRCGETLKSIFETAMHPDKVVVGLIEQNDPEDKFCISEYCAHYGGAKNIKTRKIRKDVTTVIAEAGREAKCPHFDQIRLLAFHNLAAKGPGYARSLTRKIVGNEEFCLQIDSHTNFIPFWDEIAKEEWRKAGNEFAIISTAPPSTDDKPDYVIGGVRFGEVPRQCHVPFADNGIPTFVSPADAKATGLKKPLLAHTWNAGFSFSKCHIEETAPYDPFMHYMVAAEEFARFARFWTRGYDVYTPSHSFLFHDYNPNPEGHDQSEWFKRWKDKYRQQALKRAKTYLELPGGDESELARANLGIYGLGKRRTLQQLNEFMGIDLTAGKDNTGNLKCGRNEWVPYDPNISPMDNLYDNPSDLDPQPIFPLRTELTFYKQEGADPVARMAIEMEKHAEAEIHPIEPTATNAPPAATLLTLWLFGLMVWCVTFIMRGEAGPPPRRPKGGASGVKDV